jgi:MFS transporter, PPP family, 3-phenylpropionic acid transporter
MRAALPATAPSAAHAPGAVWAARAYYFLFFGALGVYYPYINLYFKETGLSGQAIGQLAALSPMAIILASPAWGALGDRFRIHRYLLPFVTWATILPMVAIAYTRQFSAIAALAALAALFSSPIIPLIDSAVLDLAEGTSHSYGSLRAWGTPGFVVLTFAMGYVLKFTGLVGLFYIYAGLLTLAGLAAWWLPARRHKTETGAFGRDLRQLLRQRSLAFFLVSAFLVGISFTGYITFFGVIMQDRGASLLMISLANVIAASSEFPVLIFSTVLLKRLGNRGSLLLGYAVYAVRWAVLALVRLPLVTLLTQGLHGISWGTATVGGVAYVKTHSPKGLEATGQSLLGAASAGVGAVVGALGSGWLYDHFGAERLFTAMSLCCAIGLLMLLPITAGEKRG